MKPFSSARYFLAAAFLLILSGCSVFPADAVSLGVGGVSYIFTGKTVVDHTMSVASGQDCAWFRVAAGRNPCVPTDENVAGDRLVFELEGSPWVENSSVIADGSDPVLVDAAAAGVFAPLGSAVQIESRSTAVAAVTTESHLMGVANAAAGKAAAPLVAPDRATRLWLPAD